MGMRFKSVKVAPGMRYTPTGKDVSVLGSVIAFPLKAVFWIYKMMFVGVYKLVKLVITRNREK